MALTALLGLRAGWAPEFKAWRVMAWRESGVGGSWAGFAVLALLLAAGVGGSRDPFGNPLPLVVWTVIWVGLSAATALLGDLWRPVAPWRGPVRLARRVLGRRGGIGLGRLGCWPAVAGLLGFAWFEIVSLRPDDPWVLAQAVGLYWLAVFVLAVAEGEDWLDRGEMLTVYFALLARVAPLWRAGGALWAGWPGAQVVRMQRLAAGEVAFVTLVLAAVSFDGLSETFWWLARVGVNPLELPGRSAVMGVNTAGLVAAWLVVAASLLVAVRLAGARGAGPMLLSFLPIGAGYHLAHYLVALLTQGQYVVAAVNDPLDRGWALLGLPGHWVSFGFLMDRASVWAIWTVQFCLIVGAHLLAVLLSLRLAPAAGWRAHLPVTALMVGYTVFGLWLLAAPSAG